MKSYVTPEEHARLHRRRRRQTLGLGMALLMLIGVFTVLGSGFSLVARLSDDTEERLEYEQKLEGLVLFDPLPFDGIENIDDLTLREAAVWGCVYAIQETDGNFDHYERDPETEQLMLPAVDVDAYLAKLVGPTFQLNHRSFDMDDMTIEFDETSQCYLIPITGSVGYYRASVTALFKQEGKLHVTVGYIPMSNEQSVMATQSDTPTKYMDYIFERVSGSWYLTGLTESATKPEATSEAAASSVIMMDEQTLQEAILAGVNPDAASSEAAGSAAASESTASESTESAASSEAASASAASSAAAA